MFPETIHGHFFSPSGAGPAQMPTRGGKILQSRSFPATKDSMESETRPARLATTHGGRLAPSRQRCMTGFGAARQDGRTRRLRGAIVPSREARECLLSANELLVRAAGS